MDAADAFAFVMPEYNYGMTAPLKNALDFLHSEWQYNPVSLVSYGGISAGLRAAQMVKQVVTTLKMVPLSEAVSIPFVARFVDDDGVVQPNEIMEQSATTMLEELVRVGEALSPLRERQPRESENRTRCGADIVRPRERRSSGGPGARICQLPV